MFSKDHTQQHKDIIFRAFDQVTIRLSLDATNVQHEKLVFELVKPYIPGFSVEPLAKMEVDESESATDDVKPPKRKPEKDQPQPAVTEELPQTKKGKKNKKQKK